ncbi:MAG: hypothetical protein ABIO86_12265 [Sphingomonas sp.]
MAANPLFFPASPALVPFFPDPDDLPPWPLGKPEPTYDHIYVVRINNANPATYRVEVRDVFMPGGVLKKDLDQAHLILAQDSKYDVPGATTGKNLDLRLNTSIGALVIFHMTDPNATFVDAAVNGVVKAAGDPDLIYQAEWVKGFETNLEAVSVILEGVPWKKGRLQRYGLGVRINNDDGGTSDICIDPKIENDGEGGGGVPL